MGAIKRARKLGKAAGLSAASWAFDGNTSDENYRTFLQMSDDGDPGIGDVYGPRGWLAGEYADDPTPRSLAEDLGIDQEDGDRIERACDAYEEAAEEAYWAELERVARLHAEPEPEPDTSGLDCEGMFGAHSSDRVDVYRGVGRLIVCGRHATEL